MPQLTPLAVFAMLTSGSPLFVSDVLTKHMSSQLPPFIYVYKHAYELARKRELYLSGSTEDAR